jgi:hypothetical protein
MVGVKNGRKLVAMAVSVSAATPAYASGEDAATDVGCDIAYYSYHSYHWDYCDQIS